MEVKNYWIRILILLTYFCTVFIISRIIDLVLWYRHGYVSNDLVDPIVLNVRQLKWLLDSRGVGYSGVLEKQLLVELLNDSAHVVKGELDLITLPSNSSERIPSHPPSSSLFTGASHFNEKVEDTKDSVWLVQVMPATKQNHETLLDDYSWRYLKHYLAPFDIQTGVFDCSSDRELCLRKNWLEPILLLALPRGNRPKDHIIIRTSNTPKLHNIIKWVKEQLSIRVNQIKSLTELEEDWMTSSPQPNDSSIKVVLFTNLLHTPLFFAALSIKFTGRIKFGMFSLKKGDDVEYQQQVRKTLSKNYRINKMPTYLILTPEKKHVYGNLYAEHFNLFHMNVFLKVVQPEMNDVFIVALVLINMLATVNICQIQGNTKWLFLMRGIFLVICYNLFFFMCSLVAYNLSWTIGETHVFSYVVSALRYLNFSKMGSLIRSDILSLYSYPMLFIFSFVLYSFSVSKLLLNDEESNWYEWDFFPIGNSFIVEYLFRPIETPIRNFANDMNVRNSDLRFERLVISRSPRIFNVPLWLQPPPRFDYISELPIFHYKGWKQCKHKEMALIENVMDGEHPPSVLNNGGSDVDEINNSCDYLECKLVKVEDCAICLESYEHEVILMALPCAHNFHKTCVLTWLNRGNSHCPVCRWPAYKQKYNFHF